MIPTSIRNTFFTTLSDIENDIASFVHKPGSHMTRHRYCDFKDTISVTLSLSMNKSNTESDQQISIGITRAIRKHYKKHPEKYKCILFFCDAQNFRL